MEQRSIFYGTPLNRSINDDQDTPGSRRSRVTRRQTVRDEEGRQRFHGAFTGGFSAGYYNTVDTVEGFRPRQFVSQRRSRLEDGETSRFTHKPEDYMDEEDLGEFGIAPKKIRLQSNFSNTIGSTFGLQEEVTSTLINLFEPKSISIGEKILNRTSSTSNATRISQGESESLLYSPKNDYHGLGYKSLKKSGGLHEPRLSNRFANPLTAVLSDGKRLKISGEAFGSGVLDEDDDCIDVDETYNYDDITHYQQERLLPTSSSSRKRSPSRHSNHHKDLSEVELPGFVLGRKLDDLQICDNGMNNYPTIVVPKDWEMPVRKEPKLPSNSDAMNRTTLPYGSSSGTLFNKKFTNPSSSTNPDYFESRSGLVLYSDLKPSAEKKTEKNAPAIDSESTELSIKRQILEWHPCGLLCKHFNVANPYNVNSFVGLKPSVDPIELPTDISEPQRKLCGSYLEPASFELKQSIFDVTFFEEKEDIQSQSKVSQSIEDDEEPQVVELIEEADQVSNSPSSDKYTEVVVVTPERHEPEVIILSSSSSPASTSLSPSPSFHSNVEQLSYESSTQRDRQVDADTYGPPLPPTLKPLIDLDRHSSGSRHRSSKKGKRSKKHRKNKRNKNR